MCLGGMFSTPGISQLSLLSLEYPTRAACGGKGFFCLTLWSLSSGLGCPFSLACDACWPWWNSCVGTLTELSQEAERQTRLITAHKYLTLLRDRPPEATLPVP